HRCPEHVEQSEFGNGDASIDGHHGGGGREHFKLLLG
ncbi:MAG: hypothetical protein RIS86_532, partial [Planctomycetota bacterium]